MGSKLLNWFGTILFFLIVAGIAGLPLEEDSQTPNVSAPAVSMAAVQWEKDDDYAGGALSPQMWPEEEDPAVQVTVTPGAALVFASESVPSPAPTPTPTPPVTDPDYILNLNTGKFHYPDCESVEQMKESNKFLFSGTRDQAISQGYNPCKNCNP